MRSLLPVMIPAVLAIGSASVSGAQQPERAVYTMAVGSDTIAIERVSRSAVQLVGEVHLIPQRIRIAYNAALLPDGRVASIDLAMFQPATDTTPRQRVQTEFRGDSAVLRLPAGERRIAIGPGVVPYVNLSMAILNQALLRARSVGGDTVRVQLLPIPGEQVFPMTVSYPAADSARVELGAVVFLARVAVDGRILAAAVPAQRLTVTRDEGDREVTIAPPDYSAPPGAPYSAADVQIETPAGLTLAGTLTLPLERPRRGAPAIVTITGSGPQNRDSEIPGVAGYRPFRQVADTLARRGIATLRLDDRGVGGSDAGPQSATSADLADDIRAAVSWLRRQPTIDSSRIGLVGHSEGGIIAPMIAASDDAISGIVLLAGTASTGREILRYQQRYVVDSIARLTGAQRDSALASFAQATDSLAATLPWISFFLDHDPSATARMVTTPVLILQGATDHQVPHTEARALERAFREGGNQDVTMHILSDINHLFLRDPSGSFSGYAALESKEMPPEVLGAIADWLVQRLQ